MGKSIHFSGQQILTQKVCPISCKKTKPISLAPHTLYLLRILNLSSITETFSKYIKSFGYNLNFYYDRYSYLAVFAI